MNRNSNDVFATLTYQRNQSPRDTWLHCNNHTNRFLQSIQRKIGKVEYLRVFEHHKDNYPHVHIHLRFRNGTNIRERDIYLLDKPYKILKQSWNYGHSDFQCPRHSGHFPIGYILKYLGKSTSTNRLWANILTTNSLEYTPPLSENGYPIQPPAGHNIWKLISIGTFTNLYLSKFKWKKIKLLSWSRGYIDTFKT